RTVPPSTPTPRRPLPESPLLSALPRPRSGRLLLSRCPASPRQPPPMLPVVPSQTTSEFLLDGPVIQFICSGSHSVITLLRFRRPVRPAMPTIHSRPAIVHVLVRGIHLQFAFEFPGYRDRR